jgi:hypothetical protein
LDPFVTVAKVVIKRKAPAQGNNKIERYMSQVTPAPAEQGIELPAVYQDGGDGENDDNRNARRNSRVRIDAVPTNVDSGNGPGGYDAQGYQLVRPSDMMDNEIPAQQTSGKLTSVRANKGNNPIEVKAEGYVDPHTRTRFESLQLALKVIVESTQVTFIMSVFTLWALFGNDIRLAGTGKEADDAFLVISSVIFFAFVVEIIAVCLYKPGYLLIPELEKLPGESWFRCAKRICTGFGSFYFWLDVIATASLIFEVFSKCFRESLFKLLYCGRFRGYCLHWATRKRELLLRRGPELLDWCDWSEWFDLCGW